MNDITTQISVDPQTSEGMLFDVGEPGRLGWHERHKRIGVAKREDGIKAIISTA